MRMLNSTSSGPTSDWLADRAAFERLCDDAAEARAKVLGQFWMALDVKDSSITPWLVKEGYWESWVSLAIARAIRPGMCCVDAGANVGYYSLLMALRGAEKVLAVEPQPHTARLLRRNVEGNRLDHIITVAEVALGAVPGQADLLRFGDKHGSDSLVPSRGYEVTERWPVEVAPLDALLAGWPRVDFVKVDVEAMEAEVWEGMRQTRAANPQMTVCMEVLISPPMDPLALLRSIERERPLGLVGGSGAILHVAADEVLAHPMTQELQWAMVWIGGNGG